MSRQYAAAPAGFLRELSGLLRFAAAMALAAVVLFAVNIGGPVGPAVLLWLPSPLAAVALTCVYIRTSRIRALPAAARRFWLHMSFTSALVGVACVVQAIDVLSNPLATGPRTGPVMLAFDGAAILVIVYALYRLPLASRSPGEVLRVALDAGTVMLATAAFIWHFQTRPALGTNDRGQWVASLIVTVLALAAVVAVAKVVLSSYSFIDRQALRLFALAMLVGSVGPLFQGLLSGVPHLVATQVSIPVVFLLAALAGERQSRAAGRDVHEEVKRRPFSMLPFVAVAAIDGLLLGVIAAGQEALTVGVAAVSTTALVVLRQMLAFRDNGRLLARLDHGANHDALTQLPNRKLFGERLGRALAGGDGRCVSVALIDLDDFKEINDSLGHEVGDVVLVAVAERLQACVRPGDTVARLGGDEFVIVLPGADPDGADRAAERIVEALREPVPAGLHRLMIRASIGIADGRSGDDSSVLLRQADIAMYAAKKLDGTGFLHFNREADAAAAHQTSLAADLGDAIANDELFLRYQPIIALDGGAVVGAEALVRWAHPTLGLVNPDDFIGLAERTGAITALTQWVVRNAARQFGDWLGRHRGAHLLRLNINISARDLREPDFADSVLATLADCGVPATRIVLEITETSAVENGVPAVNLRRLRAAGVRISLDDFGTGHSTLALLNECPADEIKLDRSFVTLDGNVSSPVARSVVHLARALDLDVIAEGVETPDQADRLRALGYTIAQGYHFGRPVPPDEFAALLTPRRTFQPAPATAA